MVKNSKRAFTLVELIVVITILAILGTIAFISLQGYSKAARDTRRTSDINNIKKSLELFSLNTGKYPIPDNGETVSYSGELLRTQGVIGDNVSKNLSRNLNKKPTDPLLESEYNYSVTNSQKEYQVLSIYEGDLAYNKNIINNSYASNNYNLKLEGNYNEIFVKTSNYIISTPSIINAEIKTGGIDLNLENIKSQLITGGKNFLDFGGGGNETSTGNLNIKFNPIGSITKSSTKAEKESVIDAIIDSYTGSILASEIIYSNLSKVEDKEYLAEMLILNNGNTSISNKTETLPVTKTCDDGYHLNGNDCELDVVTCSVLNGSGLKTWNGTIYEDCIIDQCDTDYYKTGVSTCSPVGNGYYSDSTSIERLICTNKPVNNSIYTSDGGGINNCSFICTNGYSGSDCSIAPINWNDRVNYFTFGNIITYRPSAVGLGNDKAISWVDAINYCNNLDLGDKKDWYLPSKDELLVLHNNKDTIGGFEAYNYYYWSSTIDSGNSNNAIYMLFYGGATYSNPKTTSYYVRCIRQKN